MSDALVATVVRPLLVTAALPAAGALAGLLASRLLKRRRAPVGIGLAAGLIASFVLIAGTPSWPPTLG